MSIRGRCLHPTFGGHASYLDIYLKYTLLYAFYDLIWKEMYTKEDKNYVSKFKILLVTAIVMITVTKITKFAIAYIFAEVFL